MFLKIQISLHSLLHMFPQYIKNIIIKTYKKMCNINIIFDMKTWKTKHQLQFLWFLFLWMYSCASPITCESTLQVFVSNIKVYASQNVVHLNFCLSFGV
jgi:hypothetical protein